ARSRDAARGGAPLASRSRPPGVDRREGRARPARRPRRSRRRHVRAGENGVDVPPAAVIPNRVPAPKGTERYLQPAIAREVVRYVGEPVALVVADDPYIARDALDRIDVVYQPLAACASTGEALGAGAARLFAGTDSNNVATITMRVGDADAALAGAQLTLRERF